MLEDSNSYHYGSEEASHTHGYLWEPTLRLLRELGGEKKSIFELGCGNGAFARLLKEKDYSVVGVDPSSDGIALAKEIDHETRLSVGSAYDPLSDTFGRFPILVSLEVVEHVYYPKKYASCVNELLEPGGIAIVSTPYHGYFKNLVLALTGKMDSHFTALWDHGHIKFWSIKTLSQLFAEQGLELLEVKRVGRFPIFAKSMILVFRRPIE